MAREAADRVQLDDDFAALVAAIGMGLLAPLGFEGIKHGRWWHARMASCSEPVTNRAV